MKSPLQYMGGKFHIANWIISHFPDHKVYVEPFGGAGHVLCQKNPSDFDLEVYNDINGDMVNIFKVLQDEEKAKILLKYLYLTPYSRQYFYDVREEKYKIPVEDEDMQRAYKTLVMMKQSFSGNFMNRKPSWGFNINNIHKNKKAKAFISLPDSLIKLIDRIKEVQIENLDFRDCIRKYDSKDTLFYCDPPYFEKEHYYEGNFGYEDHKELADILNNIQGKAILSYYDFPESMEWYKGWRIVKKLTLAYSEKVKEGQKKQQREELLLMNYGAEEKELVFGFMG